MDLEVLGHFEIEKSKSSAAHRIRLNGVCGNGNGCTRLFFAFLEIRFVPDKTLEFDLAEMERRLGRQ